MRVVFAGTPEVAVPTLDALVAHPEHEVVGVVTRPDAASGRGRRLRPSPVATRADHFGIDTIKPASARVPEFAEWLGDKEADIAVVVAYGAILPESVLSLPAHGFVNVHFSLLPAGRGAAPLQRSVIAGESETGVTIFEIVPALDAGPVYRQRAWPIGPDDTSGELLTTLAGVGAVELLRTLDAISAGVRPSPQPTEGVTLAPRITVEEARIDWSAPGGVIHNLVRGMNPHPGAWTMLDGERFKIWQAKVQALPAGWDALAPGELRATRRSLLVGCGDGVLDLTRVQPFGKKAMPGADWARGVSVDGAVFDNAGSDKAESDKAGSGKAVFG